MCLIFREEEGREENRAHDLAILLTTMLYTIYTINQSINQDQAIKILKEPHEHTRKVLTKPHDTGKEKPHPSRGQQTATPASRSATGLGGCE